MGNYAINHCDMHSKLKSSQISKEDLMEKVMERAGEIVVERLGGKPKPAARPSKAKPGSKTVKTVKRDPGIELIALAVADSIIENGAKKLASDFSIDIAELKDHASSRHISTC